MPLDLDPTGDRSSRRMRRTPRQVIFFADSDSQIFGTLRHAATLASADWHVRYAVPDPDRIPQAVMDRLSNLYEVRQITLEGLARSEIFQGLDAIGVYTKGSGLAQFRHEFEGACRDLGSQRPAIFTGFNGLVFEKFEEGLAWRAGYDVITVNGERDRTALEAFFATGPKQRAVVTGFGTPGPARPQRCTTRRLLVFAEQVIVPTKTGEREQLVIELARLASANPDWEILIKARIKPGEETFHQSSEHIARIFERIETPANLALSYEPLPSLLDRAGLFATISSTAIFEALERGVPSFIASDFGIRNALGTHVFHGSGLLRRLDETGDLDLLEVGQPAPDWSRQVGFGISGGTELIKALEEVRQAHDFRQPIYQAHHIASAAQRIGDSPEFQHALSDGRKAWDAREYAKAAQFFEEAAAHNYRSAKAFRLAAEAWLAAKNYEAARRNLASALDLRPQNRNIKLRYWSTGWPWRFLPKVKAMGAFEVS
ncbi:DUF6716 putative glycosyltransferase [Croceicoccus sediminis]|uniref:DUF6716 putative glycosyltransferase n=1 Tax=Croceicoccus sediminis TaxID=2571150 RepID=UPI00118414ED|nr:DUF6716 putative glycosyltransferase [Croceicoccus sediminis]